MSSKASSLGIAVDTLNDVLSMEVTSRVVVFAVVGSLWMNLGGTWWMEYFVNLNPIERLLFMPKNGLYSIIFSLVISLLATSTS